MTPTNDAPVTVEQLVKAAADAHSAFVTARERMNAAIPALDASPAERAVYDERYRADHAAEREHWRTAIELAQNASRLAALASAPAGDEVEQCVTKIMDERAAYFDRTTGHFDRADAARSYRATKAELLKGLAALARPRAAVGEPLDLFMRAAYPVAPEINPRGYNWSEAYLNQARERALALQIPHAKVGG